MRKLFGGAATVLGLAAASSSLAAPTVSGDYVEARTCSVYTGACHANGERVTEGREALMAWSFRNGAPNGVRLNGLNAVAVTAGKDNLAQAGAERESILYIDDRATPEQMKALTDLIETRYGRALGKIAAVKSAPVEFHKSGSDYTVRIPNVAYLRTTRFECNHCVMPHMVWYDPFVDLKSSIVAKASLSEYKGSSELDAKWRRADENSSFVGEFAF